VAVDDRQLDGVVAHGLIGTLCAIRESCLMLLERPGLKAEAARGLCELIATQTAFVSDCTTDAGALGGLTSRLAEAAIDGARVLRAHDAGELCAPRDAIERIAGTADEAAEAMKIVARGLPLDVTFYLDDLARRSQHPRGRTADGRA
jgi:hypothetical protein